MDFNVLFDIFEGVPDIIIEIDPSTKVVVYVLDGLLDRTYETRGLSEKDLMELLKTVANFHKLVVPHSM